MNRNRNRNRQGRKDRRSRLSIESLEDRRLMAADVNLLNGVLTIQGDSQNDWIEVDSVYENYAFYIGGGGYDVKAKGDHFLKIKLGHMNRGTGKVIETTVGNFGTKEVDKIVFYGGAGNDYFFNNTHIVSHQYGQSGNDHLHGGSGADLLNGGGHSDYLYGKEGADELLGGWGDDQLQGGDGNDILTGNWGNDIIQGNNGFDEISEFVWGDAQLTNQSLTDQIYSWSSTDTLVSIETAKLMGSWLDNVIDSSQFSVGGVTLNGSAGDDTLIGTPNNDVLTGGPGADHIEGGPGKNRLHDQVAGQATLVNNALTVVQGNTSVKDTLSSIDFATLVGSEAADVINVSGFSSGSVTIWAGAGNDVLIGSPQDDRFYGQTGDDVLDGGLGNDYLHGLDGDDTLIGGQGDDTLHGGSGFDKIAETIPGTVVIENESLTITSPTSGVGSKFVETISSIEKIFLAGDGGSDIFDASSFSGDVEFYGVGGNDKLLGGSGNDVIYAGSGHDIITGGKGNDDLYGGTGTDTIIADVSKIAVLEDDELKQFNFMGNLVDSDTLDSIEKAELSGNSSDNMMFAQEFTGETTLNGLAGNDLLRGGSGNDTLNGGSGHDKLQGGGGSDSYSGGNGTDRVTVWVEGDLVVNDNTLKVTPVIGSTTGAETNTLSSIEKVTAWGSHHDEVFSAQDFNGDVEFHGQGGDDMLWGGHGNDSLMGGDGNDTLYGRAGNDSLQGNHGNDGLFGGGDNDTLRGDTGADRFLTKPGDTVLDKESQDARVTFANTSGLCKDGVYTFWGTCWFWVGDKYTGAKWSDEEIELVDSALKLMHEETGTTKLLKQKNGQGIKLHRVGTSESGDSVPWNSGSGMIYFDTNNTFGATPEWTRMQVIHELGHNWDNENPFFSKYKAISDWTSGFSFTYDNKVKDANGKWKYHRIQEFTKGQYDALSSVEKATLTVVKQKPKPSFFSGKDEGPYAIMSLGWYRKASKSYSYYKDGSSFASEYAKTNAKHDLVETFTSYLMDKAGWQVDKFQAGAGINTPGVNSPSMAPKVAVIVQFLNSL